MNGEKKFMIGIAVVTLAIVVGGIFFMSRNSTSGNPASVNTPFTEEQKKLLEVSSEDYLKGNKDAKVTLIEYLDFECGACGVYYPMVEQISEEYKDRIKVVTRYFPLMGHKNGFASAYAVEAAARQGKYWEMYKILFDNQRTWGDKPREDKTLFEAYAKELGLNVEQFKKDVDSKEVKERVQRDLTSGTQLRVNGTPTFFLNGEKIPNPKTLTDFKSFIDNAISEVE